jgi:hypothetical protein
VRGESELHGGGDPARRLSLSNFGSGQSERMDCLVDLMVVNLRESGARVVSS